MKKVVFAGGTYCGKTTLIEYYRSLGFPIVSEAGIAFITELKESMGLEAYLEYRKNQGKEFFERLAQRQIQLEKNLPDSGSFLFFDRGMIDTIVMTRFAGESVSEEAMTYAKTHKYDVVFVCEILPSFDGRQSSGRAWTREDSEKLVEMAFDEYKAQGYDPIRLPAVSVEERVKIVNKVLGL